MKYNTDIQKRKSLRLKNYDYSSNGLYFITICVNGKMNLFGEIIDGKNILNQSGKMIERYWKEGENKYDFVKLHEYVVMPNHFHGIIEINNNRTNVGADLCVCPKTGSTIKNIDIGNKRIVNGSGGTHRFTPTGGKIMNLKNSISEIMQWFKTMTTNAYIKQVHLGIAQPFEKKLWQRNFYEHIIGNEGSYFQISEYIQNNPRSWEQDKLYN